MLNIFGFTKKKKELIWLIRSEIGQWFCYMFLKINNKWLGIIRSKRQTSSNIQICATNSVEVLRQIAVFYCVSSHGLLLLMLLLFFFLKSKRLSTSKMNKIVPTQLFFLLKSTHCCITIFNFATGCILTGLWIHHIVNMSYSSYMGFFFFFFKFDSPLHYH